MIILFFTSLCFANESNLTPEGLHYKNLKKSVKKELRKTFKKAESSLEKGNFKKADQYYLTALAKGERFHSYWGRAYCHWKMGNTKIASKQFEKAYEASDSLTTFILNYADFSHRVLKDWEKSRQLNMSAYKISHTDKALLQLLQAGKELTDKNQILSSLKELYNGSPKISNIAIFYASFLSEIEKNAEAVEVVNHTIPNCSEPYHFKIIVNILANNGYFLDAANVCKKLTDLKKRSANNYEAWGYLEFKQGHYKNAAYNYKKALNYKYRRSTIMMLARLHHFYLNDEKQATYYCKAALEISRDNPNAYYLLAEISRNGNDLESAIKYAKIQTQLLAKHPQPFHYLGKLYFEQGSYKEAIAPLEKAVELDGRIQRYRLILAKAYAGIGDKEKAREIHKNFINEPIMDLWKEEKSLKQEPPQPK